MVQLMINNGSLGVEPGLLFVIIKFLRKEVKNMKKKFLSILLSVMMVLSIAASSGVTFAAEYNDEGKISLANAEITVPSVDGSNSGENAIDGNPGTMWHSAENPNPPEKLTEDNEIIIDLKESVQVDKIRYLPRQDGIEHGRILEYEVYTSNTADQDDFELEAISKWYNTKKWKELYIRPVTAQRIKLVVKTTSNSQWQPDRNKYITAAEIELYDTTKAHMGEIVDPDNPDVVSKKGLNRTYEIYPTVQQFVYYEEEITIPEAVDVVFTGDIDNATKNHLASTLAMVGATGTEVDAVGDNFTVVAAVYDAENNTTGITPTSEDFFDNNDAYILKIEENKIIILGKDTDAVYYGITTLERIFNQIRDGIVEKIRINDYATAKWRGIIEGYYGIPYSNEDIISLMEFGSDFKMNTFIYAPKDDPYHNSKWREPYPQETIDGLKEVIQKGVETKVGFVYAIHPFMNNGINKNDFDREIKYITDKFQVFYDLGVRQFALLADDASSETPLQVKTINALQDWLDTKEGTYPLVFCPQAYSGTPSASYFNQFRDGTSIEINGKTEQVPAVDERVEIMFTGPAIIGNVDSATNEKFNDVSGRYPYMWLNWPVNDYTDSTLFIGEAEMLRKGVTNLNGLVANPMQEAELSKIGLFQVADYIWNTEDFDVHSSWLAACHNVVSNLSKAFPNVAMNMCYPRDGVYHTTGLEWDESENIAEYMSIIIEKVKKGESIKEYSENLIISLVGLVMASDTVLRDGYEAFVEEITPYLKSLMATVEADIYLTKTVLAIEDGAKDEIWNNYSNAAAKIAESNSYEKDCYKPEGYVKLQVTPGTKYLRPYASQMYALLQSKVADAIGFESTNVELAPYTSFAQFSASDAEKAKMIDGDTSTYMSLESGEQKVDDYYGVNLGKVTEITEVNILQGSNDGDHDIFHYCVLEASEDGKEWVTLADFSETAATANISWTASETTMAQYIRLRLTKQGYNGKLDYWLHVREFTVDYETEDFAVVDTDIENTEGKYEITAEAGKVTLTLTDMPADEIGNYLLLSLRDAVEVSSVSVSDTISDAMDITWSFDGKEYVGEALGLQGLTYMKAVTKENAPATVSGEIVIEYVVYEEPSVSNNGSASANNLFDGNRGTYATLGSDNTEVVVDLGREVNVENIKLFVAEDQSANLLKKGAIKLSADGENWITAREFNIVDQSVTDSDDTYDVHEAPYFYIDEDVSATVYYGDINGNGKVDVDDGTALQKYLVGAAELSEAQIAIADTNHDDKITVSDATQVQLIVAGKAEAEASSSAGAVKARYLKVEREANQGTYVINEIEINGGMSFSTVNERTIKTDAVQKEGYEAYNMVDGKLDTYFASGTEGGYIEYTINKEVGLNPFTFTVIQNSETISNAKVEVKVYGTDEYVELGTLDKSICDFTLDPQTQVVRISWDAGEEFFIHEMFY